MRTHYLKIALLFLLFIELSVSYAQSPGYFKYQAIIRDTSGVSLKNQPVVMKVEILKNNENGVVVYAETHSDTTNNHGLVVFEVGSGLLVFGEFSLISWGNNNYFLRTSLDISGGGTFEVMGVSQLLSVPYALYSMESADGSKWAFSDDTLFYNLGNVGIGTSSPLQKLHINGNLMVDDTLVFPGYSNQSFNSRGQILIGERDILMGYQNDNYGNILIGNSLYGKTVFDLQMTGNGNVGIGTDVFHETTSGASNVCVGVFTGYNLSTGGNNVFLGESAGEHISTANHTVCMGYQSGNGRQGDNNIFIGNRSGYAWSGGGSDNVMIGNSPGFKYNSTNSNCIFIGKFAGYNVADDNNVFIGPFETGRDALGTKNIFIGYKVGKGWNGSNTLLIDDKNDNISPFIKGDMENDILEINAEVTVNGNIQSESININSVMNLNEIIEFPISPDNGDLIYLNDTIRFYNGVEWRNLW